MEEFADDIALHERIFAQVLGVEENEKFAVELTSYAGELLNVLPPGWNLVIGEGELAGIPMYIYSDTEEIEWNHPYESEYCRRVEARRRELIQADKTQFVNYNSQGSDVPQNKYIHNPGSINASSIESNFNERLGGSNMNIQSTIQGSVQEETVQPQLQDHEIIFAELLGVVTNETNYMQLAYLARELMNILPEGWELLISETAQGVKVPYYFETARGISHWSHPFEEQYRDVISRKRDELDESSVATYSPPLTQRSAVSETNTAMNEEDRLALIEAMFAGSLGINPLEEFAAELGDYAKELLQALPQGWEVVAADSGSTTEVFPLFINNADGSSQLDHPMIEEHLESISDMRNALMYGVLPGELSRRSPLPTDATGAEAETDHDAAAEAQAEQLVKEQELKELAAKEAVAEKERVEAEERTAREIAAQLAAEEEEAAAIAAALEAKVAANAAAEAKAEQERQQAAVRLESERVAAEEAARLESERVAAEEAARLESERVAAEEAARLETERVAAEEAARLEAERVAAEEAVRLETERIAAEEAARLESERVAAEEAGCLEAERVAAEEAARLETERVAAEEAGCLEAERVAAEEAARLETERVAADVTVAVESAQAAELEQQQQAQREQEETERLRLEVEQAAAEVEEERLVLEQESREREALEAAQAEKELTVSIAAQLTLEEAEDRERQRLLEEASRADAESTQATDCNRENVQNQQQEQHLGPVPGDSLSPIPEADAEDQSVMDDQSVDLSVVEDVTAAPAPASPALSEEDPAVSAAAEAECAVVVVGEVVQEVAANCAVEVWSDHLQAVDAGVLTGLDALCGEVAKEVARVVAREALSFLAIEKVTLDRQAEEEAALAWAEKRAADKQAAAAAAAQQRAREAAEQAAIDAAATDLFQQQLELARTAAASAPKKAVEVPVEDATFGEEPDSLSQTLGNSEKGGLGVTNTLTPTAPSTPPTDEADTGTRARDTGNAGFDLQSVQSNAIRMNTSYLDLLRGTKEKEKEMCPSKRAEFVEDVSSNGAGQEARRENGEQKQCSDVEREQGGSKQQDAALRPLSKVSPKKAALKRRLDRAIRTARSAFPGSPSRPAHKERLWEVRVEKDPAQKAVERITWHVLGCYGRYEDALRSRKVMCRLAVSDSQGTILIDPRVDISDFDLVSGLHASKRQGLGATTGEFSPPLGMSRYGSPATAGANTGLFTDRDRPATTTFSGLSLSRPGSHAASARRQIASAGSPAGLTARSGLGFSQPIAGSAVSLGRTLPAATDTKELILGRVKRTTEKMAKVRVRKDLSRMQWIVETDELEVRKITDRHRKKKGVDIEGKSEDAVKRKAKNALLAMERAKELEGDELHQTMKHLPAMDQLVDCNLLEVLAASKSFGGFAVTSKLIESERKIRAELACKLNKARRAEAATNAAATAEGRSTKKSTSAARDSSGSAKRAIGLSAKNRIALPDIPSSSSGGSGSSGNGRQNNNSSR